ncbi:MAG TPA: hypothetical protein PKB13_00510, partial [Clostridia bacterium]|nr:hypothetical protein [Clostridia bacterium]
MRKRLRSILIVIAILFQVFGTPISAYAEPTTWQDPGVIGTVYAGGSGSVDDPYLVSSGEELAYFTANADSLPDGTYVELTAD